MEDNSRNKPIRKWSLINKTGKFIFQIEGKYNIGIDIGGTLTKIAILKKITIENDELEKVIHEINPDDNIKVYSSNIILEEDCILYLKNLYSNEIEQVLFPILKKLFEVEKPSFLNISGGGAFKYYSLISDTFSLKVNKIDELKSLLYGNVLMNEYNSVYFLEQNNSQSSYNKLRNSLKDEYSNIVKTNEETSEKNNNKHNQEYVSSQQNLSNLQTFKNLYHLEYTKVNSKTEFNFPHIIINIGSGVSIVKVNNEESFERIGGTMCGGGTLLGLSKLLLNVDDFNEILELAKKGNHRNLDLLVSDIYGNRSDSNCEVLNNLDLDVLASSFGKVNQILKTDPNHKFQKEDLAQSLLILICFQIAQLGYLFAKREKINHIFYYGTFSKKNSYTIDLLNFGTLFWGKEIKCHFNEFDGFLGSIGNLCSIILDNK